MRNTIIITVVLFLSVIAASIYYFRDINNEHEEQIKPLKYLPENTFLITSIKNDEVTDNIFKDFEVFDAILGQKEITKISLFKNEILRNSNLHPYLENSEVYISFHPTKESLQTLFTIPTIDEISTNELLELTKSVSNKFNVSSLDTLGHKVFEIKYDSVGNTIYSMYYQHVIFASYSKNLLATILDKNVKKLDLAQVDYFIKNNSRNTPFSVYFPHQQYENIVKHFQQRPKGLFLDQFNGLKGQSAWNINFKQDALMLTGESEVENVDKNYIALFRNQRKTSQKLYNVFPAATAVYMEYSLSDVNRFRTELKELFVQTKQSSKIKKALEMLSDSSSSVSKLSKALGNNFAIIEQTNQTNLGFINIQDSSAWNEIRYKIGDDQGNEIYRFNNTNIIYALYGEAFSTMSRPYFTVVNNILVLANSQNLLQQYLDDFNRQNLLTGTLGFKNFEKLQGNEANITLFVHNKNASSKILNSLTKKYQQNFKDKENFGLQDFYSWSFQLSGNSGDFSSQIYAVYKSKNALGVTPEWTYSMENKAITRPYIFEHSDTSQFILIQELDHTLHAIHPKGNKMWSTVIAGRIVGDMQQLPDRSIIFATDRNRFYRIDTEGKNLTGVAAEVPNEPIATPLYIDALKMTLVPTSTRIYAYTLDNKTATHWEQNSFNGKITTPITETSDQKYVFGTSEGYLYWLDQKGKEVKQQKIANSEAIQSIKLVDNSLIIAIDKNNTLYKVRSNKDIVTIRLADDSVKLYTNYINEHSLMTVGDNMMKILDIQDSLKTISEYYFTKNIKDAPYVLGNKNERQIAVASKATNLLYMFNNTGTVIEGFPIDGQPLFYYGKINYNSETYVLCMRRDHKLHAFKHQK